MMRAALLAAAVVVALPAVQLAHNLLTYCAAVMSAVR